MNKREEAGEDRGKRAGGGNRREGRTGGRKKVGLDEESREEVRRAEKQGQGKKQGRQRRGEGGKERKGRRSGRASSG